MSQSEISKDLAISITESLPMGVLLVADAGRKIVYANPKAEDIFGYLKHELSGLLIEHLIPERYHKSHKILVKNYSVSPKKIAMMNGRVLTGLKKCGSEVALQLGITPLNNEYILLSCIESTNEIIKPSSSNDPLTGLPNRVLFDDYAEKLHELAVRNNKSISIAFLDLDNFKTVNDQFGHQSGDWVLCEVANQLMKSARSSDLIARVGGDEFILCLYGMGKYADLKKHLDRLITQVSSINQIEQGPIEIGASIGAVITFEPAIVKMTQMVSTADKLMYQAKKSGKGTVMITEIDDSNLSELIE